MAGPMPHCLDGAEGGGWRVVDRRLVTAVLNGLTWRDSAITLREVRRQGLSLDVVATETGIAMAVLHQWLVALDVYESLDMTAVGDDVKPHLDEDGASEMLYALRHLPLDARSGAARYLLEHRRPAAAGSLIQAIKDCRRLGVREGFTCEPGNALAYQKWQMARCSVLPDDRERYLREGLGLAETEAVRVLFHGALTRETGSGQLGKSRIGAVRLDLSVRWVGARDPWPRLMPYYDGLHLLGRTDTPVVLPERADGCLHLSYEVPAGRYVAVPGWPEVAGLIQPVAVACAATTLSFPGSGLAVGEDEENVLLVIETSYGEPEVDTVFLVRQGETVCAEVIVAGERPQPDTLLGKVALVVRRMKHGAAFPFAVVDDEAYEDFLD